MGATETVDLFFELINDDQREKAIALFSENAVMGISVPGSDERTNLRGRDRVGGWFVRAGDGFRRCGFAVHISQGLYGRGKPTR